jgi:hypothetical protein
MYTSASSRAQPLHIGGGEVEQDMTALRSGLVDGGVEIVPPRDFLVSSHCVLHRRPSRAPATLRTSVKADGPNPNCRESEDQALATEKIALVSLMSVQL